MGLARELGFRIPSGVDTLGGFLQKLDAGEVSRRFVFPELTAGAVRSTVNAYQRIAVDLGVGVDTAYKLAREAGLTISRSDFRSDMAELKDNLLRWTGLQERDTSERLRAADYAEHAGFQEYRYRHIVEVQYTQEGVAGTQSRFVTVESPRTMSPDAVAESALEGFQRYGVEEAGVSVRGVRLRETYRRK
jgi:hypothetical protein